MVRLEACARRTRLHRSGLSARVVGASAAAELTLLLEHDTPAMRPHVTKHLAQGNVDRVLMRAWHGAIRPRSCRSLAE